ncbi:phospholipid carrier-dependent glycosyltransferase [Ignavibacteriales bacterium]
MIDTLKNLSDLKTKLLIVFVAAVLFLPFLGNVHLFDWDEINFAEASREMIETGDYLRVHIDYEAFYEKPPLFFWMQVISMKIFGINEFGARFPNAVIGIVTLLLLYAFGKRLFDKTFGFLWVVAYAGSILPYFYFRSGILDPLFNLFMFISSWYIFLFFDHDDNKNRNLFLAGLFSGLAVLVKGPVGLLLPGLTFVIFNLVNLKRYKFKIVEMVLFGVIASLTAGVWFGIEFFVNGPTFLEAFFKYQIRLLTTGDAGFSGPIYYHLIVVLIGCFPSSLFIFYAFKKQNTLSPGQKDFKLVMIILLSVVMVIFSIVKTKIVHYSSLSYYPVTFLGALVMYDIVTEKLVNFRFTKIALVVTGSFIGVVISALASLGIYKEEIIPYLTDEYVKANLQADSVWFGWEPVIGLLLIGTTIYSIVLYNKQKAMQATLFLFGGTALTLSLMLPLMLPQIENYVQGAPVEFYKSLEGKDVFVKAVGFRSYADIYYSKKTKNNSASGVGIEHKNIEDFLINGDIKKPAYFVTKINERDKWTKIPNLKVLYEKNGFIFLQRREKQ